MRILREILKAVPGSAWQVGGLLIFAAVTTLAMTVSWSDLPSDASLGRIARQDIRADKDYEIYDEESSEKLRQEARESVLPIFDWNDSITKEKIVEGDEVLERWKSKGILIRRVNQLDQPKIIFQDLSSILTVAEARERFRRKAPWEIQPNLFYNEEETRGSLEKAVGEVQPVLIKVEAGQSIIRTGDRYEAWHVKVINGIRKEKAAVFSRSGVLGTFVFLLFFFEILWFVFYRARFEARKLARRDLVFQAVLVIILLVMVRVFLFLSHGIKEALPIEIPLSAYYALLPVGAGTMLVQLFLPPPTSALFAVLTASLMGVILKGSFQHVMFFLIEGFLAAQLVVHVRSRGKILEAGLKLALLNAVSFLILDIVLLSSRTIPLRMDEMLLRMGMAFGGGILSMLVLLILMPVFEAVFNYLTPIKLLEFGSLNHPLLREMIMRAPGTYHHSHMVGTLAEAACEAIGADSLFARVACYFHDIGKMKKAAYFIENSQANEDRHAILAPSMSALIITSHVKDGIEMARQYKLPQRIIDIIPQHQGTKLISYFFNKAKDVEKKDLHVVDEREYRYPGPKPQTREAGVILLADTVEAATRSLKDRSPARLEEVVRNMINKNFIDGQLDECELTLKDLHTIARSFVRILMGVYHQRIEYPQDPQDLKMAEERTKKDVSIDADKYSQSKPIREDSLKNVHRLGVDRIKN